VPPSLKPHRPTSAHLFAFDPTKEADSSTVLHLHESKGVHKAFAERYCTAQLDASRYYFPSQVNHRALESMAVAISKDGKTKTLVLFQSKINATLPVAISGLNTAAEQLKAAKVWTGEFLFVIFALEAKSDADVSGAHHPTLFINKQRINDYFTATLAPAVEFWMKRHTANEEDE